MPNFWDSCFYSWKLLCLHDGNISSIWSCFSEVIYNFLSCAVSKALSMEAPCQIIRGGGRSAFVWFLRTRVQKNTLKQVVFKNHRLWYGAERFELLQNRFGMFSRWFDFLFFRKTCRKSSDFLRNFSKNNLKNQKSDFFFSNRNKNFSHGSSVSFPVATGPLFCYLQPI